MVCVYFCIFFCICWGDHIWLFSLLIWWITLIGFSMFKKPCIPGINPTWSSWFLIIFLYYWIWFAEIWLRTFCVIAHERYWSVVLLWCLCFGDQGNTNLREWLGKYSLLFCFLEEFGSSWCQFLESILFADWKEQNDYKKQIFKK